MRPAGCLRAKWPKWPELKKIRQSQRLHALRWGKVFHKVREDTRRKNPGRTTRPYNPRARKTCTEDHVLDTKAQGTTGTTLRREPTARLHVRKSATTDGNTKKYAGSSLSITHLPSNQKSRSLLVSARYPQRSSTQDVSAEVLSALVSNHFKPRNQAHSVSKKNPMNTPNLIRITRVKGKTGSKKFGKGKIYHTKGLLRGLVGKIHSNQGVIPTQTPGLWLPSDMVRNQLLVDRGDQTKRVNGMLGHTVNDSIEECMNLSDSSGRPGVNMGFNPGDCGLVAIKVSQIFPQSNPKVKVRDGPLWFCTLLFGSQKTPSNFD